MAKPSAKFYIRIHLSSRSSEDLSEWEKAFATATANQIIPEHSHLGTDEEIDPGYSSQVEDQDDRHHLRFMPGLSSGKTHAGLLAKLKEENGYEALEKAHIIVNDLGDGKFAFIVPQSYIETAQTVTKWKEQPWWNFGNEPHRVKPIVTYVRATDKRYSDWALYDTELFGVGVGPVPMSLEQWAIISLLPYGIKEGDLDYKDAVEKAKDILSVIEDEDKIVTTRKRPSLEKKRTPVRFRAGFFTSLIPEYANLTDAQKASLTDEERRPWEFWVRDPEKYPEDQGRSYWDVLGLTRNPEESLDGLKYRQVRTAWQNQTPYGREKHRIWNQSQENKEAQQVYDHSVKGREKKDAYKATEGGKQATALYQKRRAIRNKIYRTLFREINPITGNRWTEMEVDYYVWDNYGEQLLRSSWIRGEKFFIEGPGIEPNLSMNEKYGMDHIRPERISPSDLDFDDGYRDPQKEEKEE